VLPDCVRFDASTCRDLAWSEQREWLLTNGRGAYAAGTVAGTLTRRYHGLLVAPLQPPLGRVLVMAKADAMLVMDGRAWPLYSNRWLGHVVEPGGYSHIASFHLEGRMPVWRYRLGERLVEMRIWMEHGSATTRVAYRLLDGSPPVREAAQLRVRLLANARDHHANTQPGDFDPVISAEGERLRVVYADGSTLHLRACRGGIRPDKTWYRDFFLSREQQRGLPPVDNHLSIGEARIDLVPGVWSGLTISLEKADACDFSASMANSSRRDAELLDRAAQHSDAFAAAPVWIQQLILAADSYLIERPVAGGEPGDSVIAGYPWFGDWGRDTMIALPGLTLATGHPQRARRILETFARFIDRGMLPNVFPGAGDTAEYNSVDAALWYIEAWRAYLETGGEQDALARTYPRLAGIVQHYQSGTRYRIHMDPADGLLAAGEPGVQLTWMDAKIGDYVVTPRIGKPVEVNALWYNALCCMAEFAERLGEDPQPYAALAARVRTAFRHFSRDNGGLFDVLDGPAGHDSSIRPNQILAVSLRHSPLDRAVGARVVDECRDTLLTPFGLRSLAPPHPDYRPVYGGDVRARDSAYHQGTVWGWLLGHFVMAEYRLRGDLALALSRLDPLAAHLGDAGLGHISEIFDARQPWCPRGAPAQAWSVACTLEAWWRLHRNNDERTHL
jgi:4-alpha-glucanotransferase